MARQILSSQHRLRLYREFKQEKTIPTLWLLLFPVLLALSPLSLALGEKSYIFSQYKKGSLALVGETEVATLYVDSSDHPAVRKAVASLQTDIERVTGKRLEVVHQQTALHRYAVIVGTPGHSALIDSLIERNKINIKKIRDQWDGYHIQIVAKPFPGVRRALVIVGSDKRGASYGVYDISERIGVSPWHWWADVPVKKKERIYFSKKLFVQDAPKIKYRGIFLNNESSALARWVTRESGKDKRHFYEKIFELLLRLKANTLWLVIPGTSSGTEVELSNKLADDYGIVMGSSPHQPMMRGHQAWVQQNKGLRDNAANEKPIAEFWQDSIKPGKQYENIITLGINNDDYKAIAEKENLPLLEKIIKNQRKIIADTYNKDIGKIPQVWSPDQLAYDKDMHLPDDITLLWQDDNWGNIPRLPTPEERKRSGGAGVYYHFDYAGKPRSYGWVNSVSVAKIWEQMNLAYRYDATKIWVVNAGDLKPLEYPIEFFLRMAWSPEQWPRTRIEEFGYLWAKREFGKAYAEEIAALITAYTRHNSRRKPELQNAFVYSQLHYEEADRITAEMKNLVARAETLYEKIPTEYQDAFFQLVLYPVTASATVTEMYDMVAKNRLYASQGRATANDYAERARLLFRADAKLAQRYHTKLSNGKWNYFMSQPHIGYTHWHNPPANTLPVLHIYEPHPAAEMGVAVEGMSEAWPMPGVYQLPGFSPYGKAARKIEIFNRGSQPFTFLVTASEPWILLSKTSGHIKQTQSLNVSIDWEQAPFGAATGTIHLTAAITTGSIADSGESGATVSIQVNTVKPDAKFTRELHGFIEADGYVAIEAENFTAKENAYGFGWEKIAQHGRTLSSMSPFPVTDFSFENPERAPYLEYDIHFFSTGEFDVEAIFAPTWPILPGRGLRYGIGFDSEPPQIVDIVKDRSQAAWEESVRINARKSRSRHKISTPGLHKLRIYMVDPATSLQKIVIDTGGLSPSYLGPEQSRRY